MTFPPLPINILCVKTQREHHQTHPYIAQEDSAATEAMREIPTLNHEATSGMCKLLLNSQNWVRCSSQKRGRGDHTKDAHIGLGQPPFTLASIPSFFPHSLYETPLVPGGSA